MGKEDYSSTKLDPSDHLPDRSILIQSALKRILDSFDFSLRNIRSEISSSGLDYLEKRYALITLSRHLNTLDTKSWIAQYYLNAEQDLDPENDGPIYEALESDLEEIESFRKILIDIEIPKLDRIINRFKSANNKANKYSTVESLAQYGLDSKIIAEWGLPFFGDKVSILNQEFFAEHFSEIFTPKQSKDFYLNFFSFANNAFPRRLLNLPLGNSSYTYSIFNSLHIKLNQILKSQQENSPSTIKQLKKYNKENKKRIEKSSEIIAKHIQLADIKLHRTKLTKIQMARIMFLTFKEIRVKFKQKEFEEPKKEINKTIKNIAKNIRSN